MTKPTLVFDPFSEEFFNNPYETYQRMREEAPVYYYEEYDFYALTRHEDVAAGFKDYETYSSARGDAPLRGDLGWLQTRHDAKRRWVVQRSSKGSAMKVKVVVCQPG